MRHLIYYNGKKYVIRTSIIAEVYGQHKSYFFEGDYYSSRAEIIREIASRG